MCSRPQDSEDSASNQWAAQWMGDLNCPLCGSAYAADQLLPIRKDVDHWMLSVQCFCCGTGSLITTPAFAAAEISSEPHNQQALPPFSVEDVQAWHQLLQRFQGDWMGLWMTLGYSS